MEEVRVIRRDFRDAREELSRSVLNISIPLEFKHIRSRIPADEQSRQTVHILHNFDMYFGIMTMFYQTGISTHFNRLVNGSSANHRATKGECSSPSMYCEIRSLFKTLIPISFIN